MTMVIACLVIINDKVLGEHVLMRVRSISVWLIVMTGVPEDQWTRYPLTCPLDTTGKFLPARGVALYRCSVELSIGFGTLYCFDYSLRIYPFMNIHI